MLIFTDGRDDDADTGVLGCEAGSTALAGAAAVATAGLAVIKLASAATTATMPTR
jgi:hypothetical protein